MSSSSSISSLLFYSDFFHVLSYRFESLLSYFLFLFPFPVVIWIFYFSLSLRFKTTMSNDLYKLLLLLDFSGLYKCFLRFNLLCLIKLCHSVSFVVFPLRLTHRSYSDILLLLFFFLLALSLFCSVRAQC